MAKDEYNTFVTLERSLRWLRGLSQKQLKGCKELLHSLRDDIEQRTTYRVRECLVLLGLSPMLTSKQIGAIVELSQGNDLAFLWFIWEAFYKTPHNPCAEKERYTINEQLILSSIAHLDMKTTMRALDDILPPPEHSIKYQAKKRAEQLKREEKRKKLKEERRPNPPFTIDFSLPLVRQRYQQLKEARKLGKNRPAPQNQNDKMLPYLTPQLRPKIHEPNKLVAPPIEHKVIFPKYDLYKDKLYRIPNESRWFSTYQLCPVKREIKRCLSEALAPIFGNSRREPPQKSLCNVHRMLEFSTARKEQELTIKTYACAMRLLRGQKEEKRRQRIVKQLEEDVECAAQKLQRDVQRQLKKLQLLIGGTCSVGKGCHVCSKLVTIPGLKDRPEQKANLSFLLDFDFTLSQPGHDIPEEDPPVKVYELGAQRRIKLIPNEKDLELKNTSGSKAYCSGIGKLHKSKIHCPPTEGVIKVLDDKGDVVKRVCPSKIPFCPPARKTSDASVDKFCSRKTMKSGVLQWDYFKIFQPPPQFQPGKQFRDYRPIVRSYCIQALKQAMQRSTGGSDTKKKEKIAAPVNRNFKSESALETADKVAKNIFREAAKSKSFVDKPETKTNMFKGKHHVCDILPVKGPKPFDVIDPDNTDMLIQLLKIAVDIMQRDPQYVLVTLPNAHMMPILVDWVAERYGKTYNFDQMRDLAKSMKLAYNRFERTDSDSLRVPTPNRKFMKHFKCIETFEQLRDFNCHVAKSTDAYYRKLNKMALEESRIIWLALHGYSNLAGSITDTHFAYLPAKESDFLRLGLWKARDFRDVAFLRKAREENLL